jgi:hypothetical protein
MKRRWRFSSRQGHDQARRYPDETFSPFVGLVNLFALFFHMRSLIDCQYCHNITLLADCILIRVVELRSTWLSISACCLAHSIINISSSRCYNQASKLDPLTAADYCRVQPGNNQLIRGRSSLLKLRPRACTTHIGGSKEARQDPKHGHNRKKIPLRTSIWRWNK